MFTGDAVFGGDDIGRNPLGDEVLFHCDRRIDGNRRPVRAHGDAAHALNPARDIGITCAAADLVGRKVNGFHARGTETVNAEPGDTFIQIRRQHGGPRQAAALFHHLRGIAPDHVFYRVAF